MFRSAEALCRAATVLLVELAREPAPPEPAAAETTSQAVRRKRKPRKKVKRPPHGAGQATADGGGDVIMQQPGQQHLVGRRLCIGDRVGVGNGMHRGTSGSVVSLEDGRCLVDLDLAGDDGGSMHGFPVDELKYLGQPPGPVRSASMVAAAASAAAAPSASSAGACSGEGMGKGSAVATEVAGVSSAEARAAMAMLPTNLLRELARSLGGSGKGGRAKLEAFCVERRVGGPKRDEGIG